MYYPLVQFLKISNGEKGFKVAKYSLMNLQVVSYVGAVLVIAGDLARKVAIITAAENFDHLVQSEKADNHKVSAWFSQRKQTITR